jgi:polysaccharide biosynthesis protein VpsM
MGTADWQMTEKLRFKADYSNFIPEYDEDIDGFKNRVDNAFDIYGYFNFSEKTSFFLQYKYIDVAYDEAVINDSEQNFYYGGISWNTTEKFALLFKAGYQDRDFDAEGRDDYDGLALDVQANYRYSEKTTIGVSLYRMNEETDSLVASDRTVWGANLNYNQKFTEKISGTVDLRYEDADYRQLITQERDEQTVRIRPALQYLFKEWLRAEVAYEYEEVDSTQEIFEYKTNTFMLGLNLAI